jgi:hypothetical protein
MPETRKTCTGLVRTTADGSRDHVVAYALGPAGPDPEWAPCTEPAEYSWKPFMMEAPYPLCVRHAAESAVQDRDSSIRRLA